MRVMGIVVVLAALGCGSKKEAAKETAGGSAAADPWATGSGSGSGSATGSGSAVAAGSADTACNLEGSYRLRFHSNGADGWWLYLTVGRDKDVAITGGRLGMLGLREAGPTEIQIDDKACTLTIAKETQQAGDLEIALAVAGNKVTGTVKRTDKYGKPSTPIAGVRETAPEKAPDCIKPGAYTLDITGVKDWKTEGDPRDGSCKENADMNQKKIRVEVLGGEILIDEVAVEDPTEQGFGRAVLTKTADCEYDFSYDVENFTLKKAHIKFAPGSFSGTTTDFTYEVMEDGDEGENLWSCSTNAGTVVGKRIGD